MTFLHRLRGKKELVPITWKWAGGESKRNYGLKQGAFKFAVNNLGTLKKTEVKGKNKTATNEPGEMFPLGDPPDKK